MILTNNIIILKKTYPEVWEKIKDMEEKLSASFIRVVPSKKGLPTLTTDEEGKLYLHSRYDPGNEAEQFIARYREEEMEKYGQVFFYGFGLGYHVEAFAKRFPQKDFSIYEPKKEIFYHTLAVRDFGKLSLKHLKNLFVESGPGDLPLYLNRFVNSLNKETLVVVMPGYERCFTDTCQRFHDEFVRQVKNRKVSLGVNLAYEKLWTINSIINFMEVSQTPNILLDVDKSCFKDKPALLVSAGPSLEEELENIKYIKKKGLAYIFAVGSSIKALVGKGIYPDAVCSYDPTSSNRFTYQEIIDGNITHIPLIFGSSIGFETLKSYPGPKVHMIINQDTVAPHYLSHPEGTLNQLSDAPSIAVVTLELLVKLGCNPIVLVGQNFAFKKDRWYAKGIYEDRLEKHMERVKKASIEVEDVYGGKVFTEEAFNRMRFQMEQYIRIFSERRVINTTKGGAKIEGADFIPLEIAMKEFLTQKAAEDWLTGAARVQYSKENMVRKAEEMEQFYKECLPLLDKVFQILSDLEREADMNNVNGITRLFPRFDKCFKKLTRNLFFQVFLFPMSRVRNDILLNAVSEIRLNTDMIEKAGKVRKFFGAFIDDCKKDMQLIDPFFRDVQNMLINPASENE
ncbi:MAG: 6-hydroxymethylpterin diphosphokinase MptE-like protein [Dehalobacterium sp.]